MSNPKETRLRQYEGPPEMLIEGVHEYEVNSRKDMPGGKSVADNLTEQYGERGVGWDTLPDRYDDENELKNALHAPEFDIAVEGMKNVYEKGKYVTDEGIPLTGKVQAYVRESDKVDVVIYPDGKIHKSTKN